MLIKSERGQQYRDSNVIEIEVLDEILNFVLLRAFRNFNWGNQTWFVCKNDALKYVNLIISKLLLYFPGIFPAVGLRDYIDQVLNHDGFYLWPEKGRRKSFKPWILSPLSFVIVTSCYHLFFTKNKCSSYLLKWKNASSNEFSFQFTHSNLL